MVRKSIKFLIIILLIFKVCNLQDLKKDTNNLVEKVIENNYELDEKIINNDINKEEYIAILEIPVIKLKKGIYAKESNLNTVNNIKVLKESTFPDIKGGNLILAGHSGIGKYAYFNNLHKLKINDLINLYYKNIKYQFEIISIYEIKKTGKAIIKDNFNTNITLITCKGIDKQLIIIANLK